MSSSHPYTAVDDDDDTDICPVCDGQCTCRLELDVISHPTPSAALPVPSLKIKFTLPPNLIAKRQQGPLTDPYSTPLKKRGRPPKHALTLTEKPQKNTAKVRQTLKARAAAVSKKVLKRRRVAVQSDKSYSCNTLDTSYKHDQHNFPTFVSASALSSICSSSSSSASSLSDFDADADSDLQAEEESFIVADIHDKARLRRELLGGDDPQLKKRSPARDWVIRPRKKSVGSSDAEQMDVDTDDQADNQNQDEDDDEEEEEPDGLHGVEEDDEDTDGRHRYVGLATGWSEEEDESSFDADLFFANLSDSPSTSGSSSTSTRRRFHSCTPGGIDADQSSSTSESPSKTALPFEVTENWDGHLIFTNGLVGDAESRGIVDIDFERDAERFIMDSVDSDADDDSCSSYSAADHDQLNCDPPSIVQAPESSDIDMSISDADAGYEEDGGEADEGDTTDEELVGDDSLPNERAMRLFTLPLSISMGISAINPMSIVSPTVGLEKRRHRRRMDVDGDREERKIWRRRLRLGGTGPRAADILAGKTVFWEDESRDGYTSSSSNSMVKSSKGKQKASSPSHVSQRRQTQASNTPRRGLFAPTGETRQAVIGEDRKGTDVPSPHPRFYGRRNRVSVVQYLLKKHLQSQSQSSVPATATASVSSPSIISDTPSPFHPFFPSSTASPLTATDDLTSTTTTPGGDEYDTGNSTPYPCPTEVKRNELDCIVELDDVLEASFLDDSMDRECEAGVGSSLTPTSGATSRAVEDLSTTLTTASATPDSTAAVEAPNKHLTRWDVISIGAFRQTREQQQAWGPGSTSTVGDYGGVIKNGASAAESPLSALFWQHSGASSSSTGARSNKKTTSSSSIPRSSSTLKTSTSRSSTKATKRRRLMMASSTMSSPLVLPLSSTSLSTPPSKSHSSSFTSYPHTHSQPNNDPSPTHKTRKELRREKKLLKKKTPTSSPSSSSMPQPFFSTHPNNASVNNNNHHFHTHQHHPNMKTRGVSSSQRMGYFRGAVPPLNL